MESLEETGERFISKIYRGIIIALFLFVVLYVILAPTGLSPSGRGAISLLFLTVSLWASGQFPSSYIAVLAVAAQPVLGIQSAERAFLGFFRFTIFFILGSFLIGSAVEKSGLSERFIRWVIRKSRGDTRVILFIFIFLAGFLTWFIPDPAVAAIFVPMVLKTLEWMKVDANRSNFGKALLIGTASAAATGAVATPVGAVANMLAVHYLYEFFGVRFSFLDWTIAAAPLAVLSFLLIWLVALLRFPPETPRIEVKIDSSEKMGSFSLKEVKALAILLLAIFLWVFCADVIPMALSSLLCGLVAILLRVTTWRDAMRGKYGLLLLFGGALSLGDALKNTGAGDWISESILTYAPAEAPILLIFIIGATSLLLATSISDAATIAVLGPIAMGIAKDVPLNPKIFALMTAIPTGFGYILPEGKAPIAIAYKTGLIRRSDIMKLGLIMNVISLCLFALFIYTWWSWLGIVWR